MYLCVVVIIIIAKLEKYIRKTKRMEEKNKKMTLKGYYDALPFKVCPKTAFVVEMAMKCNVSTNTVRNWIQFKMKPSNPEHCKILSEATGIPVEELWQE